MTDDPVDWEVSGDALIRGNATVLGLLNGAPTFVFHDPVRVATTTSGTLASSFANGSTVDGVVLATGDRILIKDQASGLENGIYSVQVSGTPVRSTDADTAPELIRATVVVMAGSVNAGVAFTNTNGSIILGATPITFAIVPAPPQPATPILTPDGLDVRVDFSPPSPAYPYYGGTLITVLKAGGTTYNLAAPVGSGPLYIRGVTMGSLYTVKAYVVSSLNIALLSLASVAATITPAMAQPEWPACGNNSGASRYFDFAASLNLPVLRFRPPQVRTRVKYGAGSWSSAISGFSAATINDGDTTTVAGSVVNGDQIILDAGAPITLREVRMWFSPITTPANPILSNVAYSDAGVVYTPIGGVLTFPQNYGGVGTTFSEFDYQITTGAGAHRFWRFRLSVDPASTPISIAELQVYEWTGPAANVVSYNLYDMSAGVPVLRGNYPASGNYDVAGGMIDLRSFLVQDSASANTVKAAIRLTSIDVAGTESGYIDDFYSYTYASGISALATLAGTETLRNKTLDSTNTVVTQSPGDNSTKPASTAYADAISALDLKKASNLSDVANKRTSLDNLTVQGADIASATTTNIGAGTGRNINITGTTTITAFDAVAAGIERVLKFAGILTLTHNGTSLILPGAANITTAAGDVAVFESLGSGNWRCMGYQRAVNAPVVLGTLATQNGGTWTQNAFNAGDYTALGAMTWVLQAGDVTTDEYTVLGKRLRMNVALDTTTVGGTPNIILQKLIPGGFVSNKAVTERCWITQDNGATFVTGRINIGAGAAQIQILLNPVVNFTATTNLTGVYFSIEIEIQ